MACDEFTPILPEKAVTLTVIYFAVMTETCFTINNTIPLFCLHRQVIAINTSLTKETLMAQWDTTLGNNSVNGSEVLALTSSQVELRV